MATKAWIEGEPFDLDDLVELFISGDPVVGVTDGKHYLSSAALDGLTGDGGALYDAASAVLRHVNGVGRLNRAGFRPVRLTGTFYDDDGRTHVVVQADTIEIRARAVGAIAVISGQSQAPEPPKGPGLVALAQTNPDVAEVLLIMGQPTTTLGWVELWKIFEIVRRDAGDLKQRGWVPATDLDAFKTAANDPAVSGTDARHARMGPNFKRVGSMGLAAGRALINDLVSAWLRTKLGTP